MMHRKRHLHQWKHPFDAYPFEAFLSTSWQAVKLIQIESGTMTLHFADNHHMTTEKGLFSDLRIRSRKATLSDCYNFLRPGIDICVLSASQCSDNSDEFGANHVWIDAKINSIQRKTHNAECSCQYYVNCYVDQGSLGTEIRTLSKKLKVVGINEIVILQKLERNSCENQHYRWESSEDCSTVLHSKLLFGKFLSDISWLVVTSVVKNVSFCARSVENRIVYQILGSDATSSSLNMNSHISVVSFKVDKEGMSWPVVSQVDVSDTNRSGHEHDDEVSPSSYVVEGLRRSKRRNMQPERFIGCGKVSEIKVGNVRTWPYKFNKRNDDDDNDHDNEEALPLAQVFELLENCIEEDGGNNQKAKEMSSCREIIVYHRRNKTKEVKSREDNQNEHQTQLATVPLLEGGDSSALEDRPLNDKVTRSKPRNSTRKFHRKRLFDEEDYADFDPGREGINSNQGVREKRHSSWYSRSKSQDGEQAYKDRSLNAAAYKEMIDSYLKDINRIPTTEETPIKDQWKEICNLGQRKEVKIPQREDEKKISEMDMLWEEMEMALASSYFEEMKDSNGANFAETMEESNNTCQHDYRLDEEIGIYCYKCGFVKTEIKHVTQPFMEVQHPVRHQEEKQCSGKESESKSDKDDDFHLFSTHASSDELVYMEHDNVWKLIPELSEKMHVHQKKAFEFLWQNIGGSMKPTLMEAESKRIGGCVISHAPGAGKTFLIIAFLLSYLKLFPGKKPLILAPKTTLHTWYKEFIKWEISLPVYLIHGHGKRDFNQNSIVLPGVPNPSKDVKHVLDCLNKIKKWQEHPSVLVMSYTKFLSLIREGSEFAHRKYMAKALREGPGVLILDEGHNPRSTKSREILSISGELDLFERGKVIDKFEDPRGGSKVLLASITACAEGISLTAASRVVFLDSEWNPSKTKQAIARAFRPGQQKMVYVYQLLATGTLEEDKYRRTTWKEWVSSMIFSEAFEENPSKWKAEKIEDDVLREMVEEDKSKSIHMILKNEKASTN
uniref:DNA repair and recombination protein RAD54 n=1 Tax=Cajanus cajan TaxID=3821 RepID=A0A151RQY8_CAJCA|nr:DNA repair and recombination protein RAD54 [Cajanus cajan]